MPGAAPFFTIITATRNAAAALPRLLKSLAGQTYRSFELIIQDCVSTDGTVAVVEAWRDRLPKVSMVSEPDTGIYDAWNKALPRIRGQWVLFLGADDFLLNTSALAFAAEDLAALPVPILYAASPIALVNAAGCALDVLLPSRTLEKDFPFGMPVPHQGLFQHRRLFLTERFHPTLRASGDYDFFCRTAIPDNLIYLDRVYVCMGLGGLTGNLHGMWRLHLENLRISRHYFPTAHRLFLFWRIACGLVFKAIALFSSEATGRVVADWYRRLKGKPALWSASENASLSIFSLAPNKTNNSMWPESVTDVLVLKKKVVFSLLVATVDRIEQLRGLLVSLTKQSCRDFEVLIADQNPSGFLDGLVVEFQSILPLRIIPVSNKGVSAARNALLPHVKGSFITFPDDDCWYEADTLEQAAAFFATNLHVHGLLGRCCDPFVSILPDPWRSGHAFTRFSAVQYGATFVQFYRKEVVDVVGGFDSELGPGTGLPYGCGEDNDYLLRVLAADFYVVYAPSIRVCHPDISRIPFPFEKVRSYAAGRMHLLHKHNFPLWFKLANVAYPLLRLPFEGRKAWPYRKTMFLARLSGLLAGKKMKC